MDIFLLFLQMNVEGSVPLKQILIFNRKKNFLKFPQNQFDISIFVITKCDRIYTNLNKLLYRPYWASASISYCRGFPFTSCGV